MHCKIDYLTMQYLVYIVVKSAVSEEADVKVLLDFKIKKVIDLPAFPYLHTYLLNCRVLPPVIILLYCSNSIISLASFS